MEVRANIEAQWPALRKGLADGIRGVDACLGFFESIVVTHPQQVIDWCSPVLETSEELAYELGIASCLALKGFALSMFSKHDKALPLLNKALKLIKPFKNPILAGKITGAMANVHTSLGDLSKALAYGNQTLELLKKSGDKEQEGWVLHGFGMGFEEIGQLGQAMQYYEQSLAVFKKLDNEPGIGRALTGIGSIFQKKGRHAEALPFHEESLARFRKVDNQIGEARALNDLGTIALEQGDVAKALNLHTKSLELRRQIKHRQSEGTSLLNLGKVYTIRGDYNLAIEHLSAALAIASEVSAKTRMVQIHQAFADVYERAGKLTEALYHFKQFNALKEAVFSEELNVKFATIEASHELDRAEKEQRSSG